MLGENGIIIKIKEAKSQTEQAMENEQIQMNEMVEYIEDENISKLPYNNPYIPIGFTHIEGEWNDGWTIRGNAGTTNEGDEFVWVPCVLNQNQVKRGDKVVTYQKRLPDLMSSEEFEKLINEKIESLEEEINNGTKTEEEADEEFERFYDELEPLTKPSETLYRLESSINELLDEKAESLMEEINNGTKTEEEADEEFERFYDELENEKYGEFLKEAKKLNLMYNFYGYTIVGDETNSGVDEIRESVGKYGGFYIAKYEAGIEGTETSTRSNNVTIDGETISKNRLEIKPVSKAGKGVWNSISRDNALLRAKEMIDYNETGCYSTLISGEVWDTTLQWMTKTSKNYDKEPNLNYDVFSSSKGNYSTTVLIPTGSNDNYAINNIYDMAGNVEEWTSENYLRSNNNIEGVARRKCL